MKTQILLAIIPLMCTTLADGNQNYQDICKATPPKSQEKIDSVTFKYTCNSGCDTANLVKIPGDFDHPDDCAKEIASSSEELITWVPWGACWKCTAPGSGPVSYDTIVMEKVKESPFAPPPLTCDEKLLQCEEDLKRCGASPGAGGGSGSGSSGSGTGSSGSGSSGAGSGTGSGSGASGGSSSTPTCGKVYTRGGNDWDINCNKITGGPKKIKEPGKSLQECIDKCIAKGKECDTVGYFKRINQCMLFSGTPVATKNNLDVDAAVKK
ncbi:uncharacterized protein LDX57_011969 [Aspergillus melleus]|uniref:uncharacterized protein n=1 Tax=Aspergillus melleus TaxID=138277 RepID=UPI001E8E3A5B|nr:uncharacterized protein LDX57_011969 [Aspergillus melleus]KAH8434322.1 hypothetical protein LDX57_011969 [Aspergillus melleus]